MDEPLFDDTRKALVFALNAHDVSLPRPSMTVAMATGIKAKAETKAARKRRLKLIEEVGVDPQAAPEPKMRLNDPNRLTFTGSAMEMAQARAAQAGLILQVFKRLEKAHQLVLCGRLITSHKPCECRRSCCSGWAQSIRWVLAVSATCELLHDLAVDQKPKQGRGMSTLPGLRRAVVEEFFTGKERSLKDLATLADCSTITAAKHRAWLLSWLESTENDAWVEADGLLNFTGITGTFTK